MDRYIQFVGYISMAFAFKTAEFKYASSTFRDSFQHYKYVLQYFPTVYVRPEIITICLFIGWKLLYKTLSIFQFYPLMLENV